MYPEQVESLIQAALIARQRAYAPYSQFLVGAALLTAEGDIFQGCNVENASYGLTLCAERVAVTRAVAAGFRRYIAIAVATAGGAAPCGACRQVLAEFVDNLPIYLVDADSPNARPFETNLRALLPFGFKLRSTSEND